MKLLALSLSLALGCGVKGPPLPPLREPSADGGASTAGPPAPSPAPSSIPIPSPASPAISTPGAQGPTLPPADRPSQPRDAGAGHESDTP